MTKTPMQSGAVCCDFHDKRADITAHLARWESEYGLTESGEEIRPPEGWKILPFGAKIPAVHREYNGKWCSPRRCTSTVTPLFCHPHGPTRAYAVPIGREYRGFFFNQDAKGHWVIRDGCDFVVRSCNDAWSCICSIDEQLSP